jgi:hypothetical protein
MGVWQPEFVTYILVITMWVYLYCYETVFPRMLCKMCCGLLSYMICKVSDDRKVCH